MKKIDITIPDNLDPIREVSAIAKQLAKSLPQKSRTLIGEGIEITHDKVQINVTRKAIEKTAKSCKCGACDTIVLLTASKQLFVNYGGIVKKKHYCSDECRELVLSIAGEGRASITRKGIRHAFFY